MAGRRSFLLKSSLRCLLLLALVALPGPRLLAARASGHALIHDEGAGQGGHRRGPGGRYWGHRLIEGARNWSGRATCRVVLVSGPPGIYGINEADAAIRFAVGQRLSGGVVHPAAPYRRSPPATRPASVLDELQRRKIDSFLLVTSNYHTAPRATHLPRRGARDAAAGRISAWSASRDRVLHDRDDWWQNREGRKDRIPGVDQDHDHGCSESSHVGIAAHRPKISVALPAGHGAGRSVPGHERPGAGAAAADDPRRGGFLSRRTAALSCGTRVTWSGSRW